MTLAPKPAAQSRPGPLLVVAAAIFTLCALGCVAWMAQLWRDSAICAATDGCRSNAGIGIVIGYVVTLLSVLLSSALGAASAHPARRWLLWGNALAVVGLVLAKQAFGP